MFYNPNLFSQKILANCYDDDDEDDNDGDNGCNDATIKDDNYDNAMWIIINNYKSNRLVINNYCLTNLRDCIRATCRLVTFLCMFTFPEAQRCRYIAFNFVPFSCDN